MTMTVIIDDTYKGLFQALKSLLLTLTAGYQYYLDINYEDGVVKSSGQGIFKIPDDKALILYAATVNTLPDYLVNKKVYVGTTTSIMNVFDDLIKDNNYTPDNAQYQALVIQDIFQDLEIRYDYRGSFYLIYTDMLLFRNKLISLGVMDTAAYIDPIYYILYSQFGMSQGIINAIKTNGLYSSDGGLDWLNLTGMQVVQNLKKDGIGESWHTDFLNSYLMVYEQIISG